MSIILGAVGVLVALLVFAAVVLFAREWYTRRAARRLERRIASYGELVRVLRDGDDAAFAGAVERLRRVADPAVREGVLDAAREGADGAAARRLAMASDDLGITARHVEVLENSPSWERRAMAAERLGRIGSGAAVSALLSIVLNVKDEDEDVRGAALRALGRIRDPAALPGLIEALGFPAASIPPRIAEIIALYGEDAVAPLSAELRNMESDVRRMWAAEILGWLGSPRAAMPLIEALGDPAAEVRAKAAGALGKLKEPRAVDRLMEMLVSDPVPFVRTRVAQALGNIGHPKVIDYLIQVLKDPEWWVRVRAIDALEQIGKPAASALLVALEDEDPEVRRRAATALERMGYVHECVGMLEREGFRPDVMRILQLIGRAGVTEVIFGKIGSTAGQARKLLVRLAGDLGDPGAVPILRDLLRRESDPSLRSRVVQALGKLAAREAVPDLLSCLRDPDDWVRRAAVMALSAIGPQEHTEELLRLLKDPVPATRKAVCRILSAAGAAGACGALTALFDDPAPEVRAEALRAAASHGGAECVGTIEALLLDASEEVRVAAAEALARVAGPGSAAALLSAARGGSDAFLAAAARALSECHKGTFEDLLRAAPRERSREQTALLLEAAARGSGDGRLAFVVSELGAADPWLRRRAVFALRAFPPDEILGHVVIAMNDPDEAVRDTAVTVGALAGGTALTREVARRAADPSETVRFHAALALGLSGNHEFRGALGVLVGDASPAVRAAAALSLALLEDPVFRENLARHLADRDLSEKGREIFVPGTDDPLVAKAMEAATMRGGIETKLFLGVSRFALEKELAERARTALSAEERARALEVCTAVATGQSYTTALAILKNDPSPEVRARALDLVLAIRRDAEVARVVGSLLADPHPGLRVRAARVLGGMPFPEAIEALLHSLDTTDRELREAVTSALSEHLLRDRGRAEALLAEDPSTKTRKLGLIWLLGKSRAAGSMKTLLRYLEDDDPDIRAAAVGALSKFRMGIVARFLRKTLADPNARVRAAGVNALSKLRQPEWEAVIRGMLADPDPYVRQRAALGLLRMGSPAADALIRGVDSEPAELVPVWIAGGIVRGILSPREAGRHADVPRFVRELFPEEEAAAACRDALDPGRRLTALRVLRSTGSPLAREAALSLAADPDPAVRREALDFLGRAEPG